MDEKNRGGVRWNVAVWQARLPNASIPNVVEQRLNCGGRQDILRQDWKISLTIVAECSRLGMYIHARYWNRPSSCSRRSRWPTLVALHCKSCCLTINYIVYSQRDPSVIFHTPKGAMLAFLLAYQAKKLKQQDHHSKILYLDRFSHSSTRVTCQSARSNGKRKIRPLSSKLKVGKRKKNTVNLYWLKAYSNGNAVGD